MKIRYFSVFIIMSLILAVPLSAQSKKKAKAPKEQKAEKVQLFNGKDLNNWAFKLKDSSVDPATVFTVRNGFIHIKGNPYGYMRTKESYSDYLLHVEYHWPVEATNSGIFIHAQQPDTIWPKCVEVQLAAGNAGDFIAVGGVNMNEQADKSKRVLKKMAASSEKPVGEWNTIEVACKANTIEVFVNGVLQNKGTGVTVDKGHICLQSEGKDIEFRNVFLTKLKK
jgi:hypothetical protein